MWKTVHIIPNITFTKKLNYGWFFSFSFTPFFDYLSYSAMYYYVINGLNWGLCIKWVCLKTVNRCEKNTYLQEILLMLVQSVMIHETQETISWCVVR